MRKNEETNARRVLVIEDDPAIAEGIVRGLRTAGFEVELEVNGKTGAEKALAKQDRAAGVWYLWTAG